MIASVLVPSFGRPAYLAKCLQGLAVQTRLADEIIVVWQADDTPTRDAALAMGSVLGEALRLIHDPARGIVPAENAALATAKGEIVLLIDDDAIPPRDWLQKHLAFYANPSVGAVGGPAINYDADGKPFPIHATEPSGRATFYGKLLGNLYDQPEQWRTRPPREVDHLVGYNMSLRRTAFDEFEAQLRSYWQLFEFEACLQVKRRGFRVMLDYSNVIEHHPTNTAYVSGRGGNLEIKIFNGSYNHAFILAKHEPLWRWPAILIYLLVIGHVNGPGLLACLVAMRRFGNPALETWILYKTVANRIVGFRDGWCSRRSTPANARPPLRADERT